MKSCVLGHDESLNNVKEPLWWRGRHLDRNLILRVFIRSVFSLNSYYRLIGQIQKLDSMKIKRVNFQLEIYLNKQNRNFPPFEIYRSTLYYKSSKQLTIQSSLWTYKECYL